MKLPLKPLKAFKAFIRGALKSLPGPNAIIEGIENIKAEKVKAENITEAIEATNSEKPHNWVSIITQLLLTSAFIYLFVTGKLTFENLMKLLELFY